MLESYSSTSASTLGSVSFCNYSHSGVCVMVSHGFILQLPDNQWGWTLFHMFIDHLFGYPLSWSLLFIDLWLSILFLMLVSPLFIKCITNLFNSLFAFRNRRLGTHALPCLMKYTLPVDMNPSFQYFKQLLIDPNSILQ